jgi:HNH endonuclease.
LARTTDEQLATIVSNSTCIYDVLRALGVKIAGGSHSHYSARIKKLGLDTSHFTGQASNKGKKFPDKMTKAADVLVLRESGNRQKSHLLVRSMIEMGVSHICSKCGVPPEWLGNPLTLDVDHINENWLDDRLENLRFLCPNCHSQFSRGLLGD